MSWFSLKRFIVYTGIFILLIHFSIVVNYLTDGKYASPALNRITEWYVRPLFHQSWKLFAPEPPLWEVKLYYRCRFAGNEWSRWNDPGYPWLLKHYSNRFSYYGKRYMLHTLIARGLYNAARRLYPDEELYFVNFTGMDSILIVNANEYKLAEKYLKGIAGNQYPGKEIHKIQFCYVAGFPVRFEDRKRLERKQKNKVIRFPEIAFRNF